MSYGIIWEHMRNARLLTPAFYLLIGQCNRATYIP